jgi:hypothetical protein
MQAYSGSTSEGFLPATLSPATGVAATAVAPAPEDPSTTFTAALEQEQKSSASLTLGAPAATPFANATPSASADSAPSNLLSSASLMYAAPSLAAAAKLNPATPAVATTPAPAPATMTTPAPASPALPLDDDADFTGAAIVASVIGRGASAPARAANATTPAAASYTQPLATNMAHAAILTATAKNGTARPAAGTATPTSADLEDEAKTPSAPAFLVSQLITSAKPTVASPIVEKKSAGSSSERSFLQENSKTSSTPDTTSNLLQTAIDLATYLSGNQTPTTTSTASSSSSDSLGAAPISAAGMANGKKMEDMNSNLDMTNLVVTTGTNPLVMRTSADLHIALGTNHDFTDALNQVMRVAELSNMSRSTPPLRVAIEIQTPPGAIVNVYVSRQADSSYRAQLSTSDPQALSWVQGQISSLKGTTDTGSAIRWSPAQLDPGAASLSTSSSSTGNDRGYDWNRGGQQGQSGYQQEERNSRRRAADTDSSDDSDVAFAATFAAVGGVA